MRPSWIYHPYGLVPPFLIGILCLWPCLRAWDADCQWSVTLGLAFGLPAVLLEKWVLRGTKSYFAGLSLNVYGRCWEGRHLLYEAPIMIAILGLLVMMSLLDIHSQSGYGAVFLLLILLYPEYREIHRTAWARVEECVSMCLRFSSFHPSGLVVRPYAAGTAHSGFWLSPFRVFAIASSGWQAASVTTREQHLAEISCFRWGKRAVSSPYDYGGTFVFSP